MSCFKTSRLTEKSSLESLVAQMKNSGYEKMKRFEIRWLTSKEELYTWVGIPNKRGKAAFFRSESVVK